MYPDVSEKAIWSQILGFFFVSFICFLSVVLCCFNINFFLGVVIVFLILVVLILGVVFFFLIHSIYIIYKTALKALIPHHQHVNSNIRLLWINLQILLQYLPPDLTELLWPWIITP